MSEERVRKPVSEKQLARLNEYQKEGKLKGIDGVPTDLSVLSTIEASEIMGKVLSVSPITQNQVDFIKKVATKLVMEIPANLTDVSKGAKGSDVQAFLSEKTMDKFNDVSPATQKQVDFVKKVAEVTKRELPSAFVSGSALGKDVKDFLTDGTMTSFNLLTHGQEGGYGLQESTLLRRMATLRRLHELPKLTAEEMNNIPALQKEYKELNKPTEKFLAQLKIVEEKSGVPAEKHELDNLVFLNEYIGNNTPPSQSQLETLEKMRKEQKLTDNKTPKSRTEAHKMISKLAKTAPAKSNTKSKDIEEAVEVAETPELVDISNEADIPF